jgi:hypothetical protein
VKFILAWSQLDMRMRMVCFLFLTIFVHLS